MRFCAALVGVGLSLTVAGCDQTDRVFFKQGIGTELNNGDIATTTQAQDEYVADLCRQAGLAPVTEDRVVSCGPRPNDPATWWLFVQAGMNDIDQRCDAYLLWLDYVRRSKEPTIKELLDAQTATTIIMSRSGLGAALIAIAAAAFGFASNTFTNVTSRLILEVDHSTIQAVVLSHQKQYREELLGTADKKPQVIIPSKPAAIYALRSYLRLCMPMTIETQINTIMTTFSRGGTDALDAGESMISARTVGMATITNVNAPIPAAPKQPAPKNDTRFGKIELTIPDRRIKAYQNSLCVVPADGKLGAAGSATRTAVGEYLKMRGQKDTSNQFDDRTPELLDEVTDAVPSCSKLFLKNVFEVVTYGMPARSSERIAALQNAVVAKLQNRGSKTTIPDSVKGKFTDDSKLADPTRSAIAELRFWLLNSTAPTADDIKDLKNRQLDSAVNKAIYASEKDKSKDKPDK